MRNSKKKKEKCKKKKKKSPSDVGLIVFLSPNIRDSINIIIFRFLISLFSVFFENLILEMKC